MDLYRSTLVRLDKLNQKSPQLRDFVSQFFKENADLMQMVVDKSSLGPAEVHVLVEKTSGNSHKFAGLTRV
jgi:hypothetical protein